MKGEKYFRPRKHSTTNDIVFWMLLRFFTLFSEKFKVSQTKTLVWSRWIHWIKLKIFNLSDIIEKPVDPSLCFLHSTFVIEMRHRAGSDSPNEEHQPTVSGLVSIRMIALWIWRWRWHRCALIDIHKLRISRLTFALTNDLKTQLHVFFVDCSLFQRYQKLCKKSKPFILHLVFSNQLLKSRIHYGLHEVSKQIVSIDFSWNLLKLTLEKGLY